MNFYKATARWKGNTQLVIQNVTMWPRFSSLMMHSCEGGTIFNIFVCQTLIFLTFTESMLLELGQYLELTAFNL